MAALRQTPLKLSAVAGSPHLRLMASGARAFSAGELYIGGGTGERKRER